MIRIFLPLLFIPVFLFGFRPAGLYGNPNPAWTQEEDDSVIWHTAVQFADIFNEGDSFKMVQMLPEDFMFQLLHDNFLGKKGLINIMMDKAVHSTFKHVLIRNARTVISYADDNHSASLNVSIEFLDPAMVESVKKERGYGLSIMYFQKVSGRWWLKTVHLDLHCSLCNE